jgi:hypothetical protein
MFKFKRPAPAKSVMFAVAYDDGRTAYLTLENHGLPSEDYLVGPIAREQQKSGALPPGTITRIKRVR